MARTLKQTFSRREDTNPTFRASSHKAVDDLHRVWVMVDCVYSIYSKEDRLLPLTRAHDGAYRHLTEFTSLNACVTGFAGNIAAVAAR